MLIRLGGSSIICGRMSSIFSSATYRTLRSSTLTVVSGKLGNAFSSNSELTEHGRSFDAGPLVIDQSPCVASIALPHHTPNPTQWWWPGTGNGGVGKPGLLCIVCFSSHWTVAGPVWESHPPLAWHEDSLRYARARTVHEKVVQCAVLPERYQMESR